MDATLETRVRDARRAYAKTLGTYVAHGPDSRWGKTGAFAERTCAAFTLAGRPAGEANDCTVRALTMVTRLTYEEAHAVRATLAGRVNGRGAHPDPAYKAHGGVWRGSMTRPTLAAWMREPAMGFLVLRVDGHVAAVIDGRIIDAAPIGPRTRVLGFWRFPDPTA